MFKKAADTEAFLKRVANHSITPSRRGDSSHLTNEPDVQYTIDSTIRDMITMEEVTKQIEFAVWEKQQITVKLTKVNAELKHTLPRHKFDVLERHRKKLAAEVSAVEAHLGELKAIRRKLHDDAKQFNHYTWAEVFKDIAKQTLPSHVFEQLWAATEEVMRIKHREPERT